MYRFVFLLFWFLVLVLLIIAEETNAASGDDLEWVELLRICRKPGECDFKKKKTPKECKAMCAEKEQCAIVKYYAKKKKCWLCESKKLRFFDGCRANYDFFIKVNKLDVKWVEHLGVCRTFYKQYLVLKKKTAIDCKNTCASDGHCAMVRYYDGTNKCSLCNSVQLDPSDDCPFLSDFYIKVIEKNVTGVMPMPKTELDLKIKWIPFLSFCAKVTSFKTTVAKKVDECLYTCENSKSCVMVKYKKDTSQCELCNDRKMSSSEKCEEFYDFYVKSINECDKSERKCKKHAICKIEKGHQYCECQSGFEGDASKCKDIDECQMYENLCGRHAHCINTPGSYKCSCNQDYVGDGFICSRQKPPRAL